MRRLAVLAPFQELRGNLGSRQELVYNPDNNRAFDAIEGEQNAALNYEPRIIGKKSANGRYYFCVKTRSTTRLNTRTRTVMSQIGAIGAIYGALVKNKTTVVYQNMLLEYKGAVHAGYSGTFRKFWSAIFKNWFGKTEYLQNIYSFRYLGEGREYYLNNPFCVWFATNGYENDPEALDWTPEVRQKMLSKFVLQLNPRCWDQDHFSEIYLFSVKLDGKQLLCSGGYIPDDDRRWTSWDDNLARFSNLICYEDLMTGLDTFAWKDSPNKFFYIVDKNGNYAGFRAPYVSPIAGEEYFITSVRP